MRGFFLKMKLVAVFALFIFLIALFLTGASVCAYSSSARYNLNTNIDAQDLLIAAIIVIAVSLAVAGSATAHKISQMNTAKGQNYAENYKVNGSTNIYCREDIYLYSTVHKVPRPKNNNNSRGSGRGSLR